ncbi:MAG TPA: tetratricopeptide repeat-containing glycosyltransferase family protein, partial [Phycisphaerae bacterium]|nr:tetratricopeptide repeat-containing glycosyltransferase family protein [Phycisphaerae bacterium]
ESQNGRHQAALELISQAITINPRLARYQNNLGLVLVNLGRLQDAVAAYRRALELDPDDADAHYNLGVAWQNLNRMDEAMAEWRTAIRLKSDHFRAYGNLGAVLLELGRTDEALAALQSALKFNPSYAEAYNNLGVALREKGQVDEAIAACRTAIQIKPDYLDAFVNLDTTLLNQGVLSDLIFLLRCPPTILPELDNLGLTRHEARGSDGVNPELARIMDKPSADAKIELGNYLTKERAKLQKGAYLIVNHPRITAELVRSVTDALVLEIRGETVEKVFDALPLDIRRILPPQDHPTPTLAEVTAMYGDAIHFSSSGKIGDILSALPTIRALSGGRKAVLWIDDWSNKIKMTEKAVNNLAPLLKQQPYIADVRYCHDRRPGYAIDLNKWKYRNEWSKYPLGTNLADRHLSAHHLKTTERDTPWLTVEKNRTAPIVFYRSARYHDQDFPWKKIVERFGRDAVFLGLAGEHADFCRTAGNVRYVQTQNLLEAAEIIAGADFFIGNQSALVWIAHGLFQNVLVEEDKYYRTCRMVRAGACYSWRECFEGTARRF